MLKFRCACGQKVEVPDEYAGRLVQCPKCRRTTEAYNEPGVSQQGLILPGLDQTDSLTGSTVHAQTVVRERVAAPAEMAAPAPVSPKPSRAPSPAPLDASTSVPPRPAAGDYVEAAGAPAPADQSPPDYAGIVRAARLLGRLGALSMIVGLMLLVGGVVLSIVTFATSDGQTRQRLRQSAASALVPILYGPALLIAGAFLRMIGSLALAVRDIARNSFVSRRGSIAMPRPRLGGGIKKQK